MNISPTRKVNVGVLSGAIVSLLVWIASQAGHPIPGEVGAGLTTIISFAMSWLVPAAEQE